MKWTQSVLSCAGVLACLVIALTGCGKTPAGGASGDATDINDSTSASADVTEATAESETTTASVSTDGTAGGDPLTTTTTTKTAPTQGAGTKPIAAQVGNANFKPGTLYKGPTLNFRKSGDAVTLGVWWWNLQGIVQPVDGVDVDTLLDMLIANRVTEIYLDVSKMMPWDEEEAQGGLTEDDAAAGLVSERHVRGFVKKCNKYGIRVAALTGASGDSVLRWIDPSKNNYSIRNFAEKIGAYQANAEADERFYAIHLDVEPHTMGAQWTNNRAKYTQWTCQMIIEARKLCDQYGLQLEYDVWSWFKETDMVTDENGVSMNVLDLLTKKCHALGVMSYFNTGDGQFTRATDDELAYAKKNNCRLIAGTETIKIDPSNITYYYSGKEKLMKEQEVLRAKFDGCGYKQFGGAIHHVYAWYALMKK